MSTDGSRILTLIKYVIEHLAKSNVLSVTQARSFLKQLEFLVDNLLFLL